MEIEVKTVITQTHKSLADRKFDVVSIYSWTCEHCGKRVYKPIKEQLIIETSTNPWETVIKRKITVKNDGEDCYCPSCQTPEARRRRLLSRKFEL